MPRTLLIILMGGAVAAAIAGFGFWKQWGAHLDLRGQITRVASAAPTETGTIAIADVDLENISNVPFVVSEVSMEADGVAGLTIANSDAPRMFAAYPSLGQQRHETLKVKDRILPQQKLSRMFAFQFPEMPESAFARRKRLTVSLRDVDGRLITFSSPAKP
jgi:Flp pilus assembly protein CpaB